MDAISMPITGKPIQSISYREAGGPWENGCKISRQWRMGDRRAEAFAFKGLSDIGAIYAPVRDTDKGHGARTVPFMKITNNQRVI
jgi:hypothetical protein